MSQTQQTPHTASAPQMQAPSAWQSLGRFAAIGGALGIGFSAIAVTAVLIGEIVADDDSPARPANVIGDFVGTVEATSQDPVLGVQQEWSVRSAEALARIERETHAVTAEIDTRAQAVTSRIDAADRQLAATQLTNIFNQAACLYVDVQAGAYAGTSPCQHAQRFRANTMAERSRLIGDVEVLYTDDQVRDLIGLPADWASEF